MLNLEVEIPKKSTGHAKKSLLSRLSVVSQYCFIVFISVTALRLAAADWPALAHLHSIF
jgi:hypothetical protein